MKTLHQGLTLVALIWVYLFTYNQQLNNPNERTRVLQARAIAEHGQLFIGEKIPGPGNTLTLVDLYGAEHKGLFVNDVTLPCDQPNQTPPNCAGPLYPAKAPGTSLLAVPALFVASQLNLVPSGINGELRATWIVRYLAVVPLMLLGLWVLGRFLMDSGVSQTLSTHIVIATGLGTSVMPYGIMGVGHALAGAALLTGVWLITRKRNVWAGLITASAVLFEYHSLIGVLCIGLWLVADPNRRSQTIGFCLGGVGAFAVHCTTHIAMYGNPFRPPHDFLVSQHNIESQATGFLGMSGIYPGSLAAHLGDPYMGLLPLMPWLAIAGGIGLVHCLKSGTNDFRVVSAIVLAYLVFVSTLEQWRVMNGWSIGPRYLVPAMIPLAFVAGLGWHKLQQWRPWAGSVISGLAAASIVMITSVTSAFPSPPNSLRNVFSELALPLLSDGFGVRNLGWAMGLGSAWILPLVGAIAVAVVTCIWQNKAWKIRAVALSLAVVWVAGMATWQPTPPKKRSDAVKWVQSIAEGPKPQ